MSSRRYRPKRRLRSELFPLAVITSLPLALYFAFPSGTIDFTPAEHAKLNASYSAFVSLDSEDESRLLKVARASWQSDSSSRRGVRANLLSCGTESVNSRIASGLRPGSSVAEESTLDYEGDVVPSGLAAEMPKALSAEKPSAPAPAFPKEDLLKLN